jgi:hypothetical protein
MTSLRGAYVDVILPLPTSLKLAQKLRTKHYFTGKPCKRGHIDIRFTKGGCRTCAQEDTRKYYAENPAKYIALNAEWVALNPEKRREIQNAQYARNSASIKAKARTQDSARALRVPKWANIKKIEAFYAACPEGYEVDHVLPLQGKFVSGLHVLENLQYLTIAQNRAKRNKWVPE